MCLGMDVCVSVLRRCVFVYVSMYICVYMHLSICVCVCVYVHVSMCVSGYWLSSSYLGIDICESARGEKETRVCLP